MRDGSLFQMLDFTDYTINSIDYSPIATGTVVWSDQYGNI